MHSRPRIALIHATRFAIDPIEKAAGALWPEAEFISIMDESLSVDRAKSTTLSAEMGDRICQLARYAEAIGADGILFTCSAFGAAIEQAASTASVPVLKPNEAMFDAALSYGERVSLIVTFAPAAAGMEDEFRTEARRRGSRATLKTLICDQALEAKQAGDADTHNRLIAEVAAAVDDADVILLAQFSMASAATLTATKTALPILTSPEAAIEAMRHRVQPQNRTP